MSLQRRTHSIFPCTVITQLMCALVCSVLFSGCFSQSHPRNLLGGVSFPVYHKRLLVSNPPSPISAPAPSPASDMLELLSELVTLGESFGQFFAVLQMGTPAVNIAVTVDTGSELTWIQCMPCLHCGVQQEGLPIFDPANSSSYQSLTCLAAMCQGDDTLLTGCSTDGTACTYNVSYGDKSFSAGVLAQEALTFMAIADASTNASFATLMPFVFGCGFDNEGKEAQLNASGLMGLDLGMYSIISQLQVDVFSYCLPNRASDVDVSGYLTFGGVASSSSPSLQYTPMIKNPFSPFFSQFYYLNLTGVSINGSLLENIPAAAFEIDAEETGWGGTIIDSGTTFTQFVDEAYTVIIQAFENYMGDSYTQINGGPEGTICYRVPLSQQQGAPAAPQVTLHLEGSVDLELGTDQLFVLYSSDSMNNYYCLAIASGGPLASRRAGAATGPRNILGNVQQQDFLVQYDIANSRVGFAPTQCSQ